MVTTLTQYNYALAVLKAHFTALPYYKLYSSQVPRTACDVTHIHCMVEMSYCTA